MQKANKKIRDYMNTKKKKNFQLTLFSAYSLTIATEMDFEESSKQ